MHRRVAVNGKNFKTNVLTLLSGGLIAQSMSFFTLPIVSRLYSQEAFGEFNLLISASTIISQFGTLGLNSAIMLPKDDVTAKKILQTTFIVHLIIMSIILCVCLFMQIFIKQKQTNLNFSLSCFAIYILAILTNLSGLLSMYINRIKKYRILFWNAVIGQISVIGLTIPMGLIGFGSWGFVLATVLGSLAVNLQMMYRSNPFSNFINLGEISQIIKTYIHFVKHQFSANIISTFCIQLPNQLISMNFGNSALGGYAMCQRLLGVPVTLIATPINAVYFQTASEYYRESKDLGEFTYRLIRNIMLVGFIPLVVLVVFAEPVFSMFLGAKWREAGVFASILAFQYLFAFCNNCTSYCRVAIERTPINSIMAVVQIFFIVTSIGIGVAIFGDLYKTMITFTIGNTLYQIIDLSVNFYLLKTKYIQFTIFTSVYLTTTAILVALLWAVFR